MKSVGTGVPTAPPPAAASAAFPGFRFHTQVVCWPEYLLPAGLNTVAFLGLMQLEHLQFVLKSQFSGGVCP